jgi:hypothetical protein
VDKIYKTVPAYLDCKAIKKAWLVSSWSTAP